MNIHISIDRNSGAEPMQEMKRGHYTCAINTRQVMLIFVKTLESYTFANVCGIVSTGGMSTSRAANNVEKPSLTPTSVIFLGNEQYQPTQLFRYRLQL
jgi:hypothetical protein